MMKRGLTVLQRRAVWLTASGLATLTLATSLRYGLVEREGLGLFCEATNTRLCTMRDAVIALFAHNRLGYLGLASALLALLPGCRSLAWLGWIGGLAGLILYCFDFAAPAALLSLLLLSRPVAASNKHSTSQA